MSKFPKVTDSRSANGAPTRELSVRSTFSLFTLAVLLLAPNEAGAALLPFRSFIYGEANAQAGFASDRDWRLRCPGASSFCPTDALSWDGDATLAVSETGNIGRSDFYSLRRDATGEFAARIDSGEIKALTSATVAWDDINTPFHLRTVAANAYVSVVTEDSVMLVPPADAVLSSLVHVRLTLFLDADVSLAGNGSCANSGASAFAGAIFGNSGSNYLGLTDTIDACPRAAPPSRVLVQEGHFEAGVPLQFQQQLVISAAVNPALIAWQSSTGSSRALVDAMHTLAPQFEVLTPGYTYVTSSGFVYDGPGNAAVVPEPALGVMSMLSVLAWVARRRRE